MSQDNWIKLDEKPVMMGFPNFNAKGISINAKTGNPNLKRIELNPDEIDLSNRPEIKIESRPLRDCFNLSSATSNPDDYIHRLTNQTDHTRHLDTYMRGEVEFNSFGEDDIINIMANAGKQIDRFYDVGALNDEEYAAMNTAIENRAKDLVKQLYSCRAAIEERDICAKAFNENNQRIYITSEEHTARMEKLYNSSSIKFDDILDMIRTKRAAMWRDWLPESWRKNNKW